MPVEESTCPRMTEEPSWPGVTLRSYQPARLWLASGGTWTVPSALRPSGVTGADTCRTGISIRTGADEAIGAAVGTVTGWGTDVPTTAGSSRSEEHTSELQSL